MKDYFCFLGQSQAWMPKSQNSQCLGKVTEKSVCLFRMACLGRGPVSGAREGTLGGTGAVCRLRAQCFFLEKLLSLSVLHTSSAPCLWNGHMEPANGVSHAQLLVRPPVSTPGQGRTPGPQCVLLLGTRWLASQGQEMLSTVNYLWHTDDLLGQGATASVYKARNKVGHSPPLAPSCPGSSWPSQPLVGHRVVCGWAEASGLCPAL